MSERYTRRSELLTEAEKITTQDRNKSYGEPDEDFQRIAAIASAMGFRVEYDSHDFRSLTGSDVARFMIALKLSRLAWMPEHRDSWLDIAGYAGCGYETASLEKEREAPNLVGEPIEVLDYDQADGKIRRSCSLACSPKRHVFAGDCLYRRTGSWLAPAEGER